VLNWSEKGGWRFTLQKGTRDDDAGAESVRYAEAESRRNAHLPFKYLFDIIKTQRARLDELSRMASTNGAAVPTTEHDGPSVEVAVVSNITPAQRKAMQAVLNNVYEYRKDE